jgi:indole-3-glycerol phosphate synthase
MHQILSLIVEGKKKRLDILYKNKEGILSLLKKAMPVKDFKKAIMREGKLSFIAEIKQSSPSAGILCKDFNPVAIAKAYKDGGAHAISVVTEEEFFLGKLNYVGEVKKAAELPVLRKDFILDEIQVYESRAAGADALLLIMAILTPEKFKTLFELTHKLGMHALVEVHTEKELRKALSCGVELIGINNRNLHTFEVDLKITQKLVPFIPNNVVKVSESGINELKDILLLKGLGVDAVLVGTTLMKAENIVAKLKELNIDR